MSECRSSTESVKVDSVSDESVCADKIRFPAQSYTRDEFYHTTDNIRCYIKLSLINGAQAVNVPVGIEDLVEFGGDVEMLLSDAGLEISYQKNTYWTVKLQSKETTFNTVIDNEIERRIELLASEHGLGLQKQLSFSGRGYDSIGYRVVVINYTFGTYREDADYWISCAENPTCRVEWVGGSLGRKRDLNASQVKVKEVTTKSHSSTSERVLRKLKEKLSCSL